MSNPTLVGYDPLHDRVQPGEIDPIDVLTVEVDHVALIRVFARLHFHCSDQPAHDVAVRGGQLRVIQPPGQIVSGALQVNPIDLVRRTIVPMLAGTVSAVIFAFLFIS